MRLVRAWFWSSVRKDENPAQTLVRVLGNLFRISLTFVVVSGLGLAAVVGISISNNNRNDPSRLEAWVEAPISCSPIEQEKRPHFFVVNPTDRVLERLTIDVFDELASKIVTSFVYEVPVPPKSVNIQTFSSENLLGAAYGCRDFGEMDVWKLDDPVDLGVESAFHQYLSEKDTKRRDNFKNLLGAYLDGRMDQEQASVLEEGAKRGLINASEMETKLVQLMLANENASAAGELEDAQKLASASARIKHLISIAIEGQLVRAVRAGNESEVKNLVERLKALVPGVQYAINSEKGSVFKRFESKSMILDGAYLSFKVSASFDDRPTLSELKNWNGAFGPEQISVPIRSIDVEKVLEAVPVAQIKEPTIFSRQQQKAISSRRPQTRHSPERVDGYADWVAN
jgi:hypothetical protein